jgi:serine-type D-Ala-D-Ala carboxypeptidase (penicillin-binding protein 5/6)
MQISVLERVERRRRRRRRRGPLLLLVLAVALGLAAFGAHELRGGSRPQSQPAKHKAPSRARTRHRHRRALPPPPRVTEPPLPLLGARSPVSERTFTPHLTAASSILVDARTGRVLWAHKPHKHHLIASTTKIMTAVVALERLRLGTTITIARAVPKAEPVREGLRRGERVPAWKLLYSLLLFSGNDDALALAIASGGSRTGFIALMNRKARELGLDDTRFASPSGLVDAGNYSTVWDLAGLARYAMANPRFRKIVGTRIARVHWAAPTYGKTYINRNQLLVSYRGADGVKTGWTTLAGHCLVASAHRGRVRLIAVVLRARDPYRDATRLLNFGFELEG